ncbi:MAG: acyltransferase domain-containing protein [Actinomycetota bacterium]|nr:acyltransferase domain-containing protein [Actinomycetota bacterium]
MSARATPPAGRFAIMSAALRLPGADSLASYWDALVRGTDSITRAAGASPNTDQSPLGVPGNARFVPAYGRLADVTSFDHERFGMSAAESLRTDPQQRLLLEVVDEALHLAAVPSGQRGSTAVFVGTGLSSYEEVVRTHLAGAPGVDDLAIELGTARDYAAGKIAYQLDLRGPVVNVLAACSTGLLAVHLGCRALLSGEADVAVAGVAAVRFPEWAGYWAVPGSISSPDGSCRPFDARAGGTVPADGVGAVVLRRLEDAVASGDDILAVIRGSAANNDGRKPGFGNVSSASQRAVILAALRAAEVEPGAVSYVESHGTGTRLGDAVEWSTLQRIFGANNEPVHVGAVKGNVGHTREAAGIAGLFKAVLSLRNGTVPPTANFVSLPADLSVAGSPIRPVPELTPLPPSPVIGVSAFGLGGSNCHVVLEAAPETVAGPTVERGVILLSSHRTDTLDADTAAMRSLVYDDPEAVGDLAARSQRRAHQHTHRRYVSVDGTGAGFSEGTLRRATRRSPKRPAKVAFVFSGVGSEYVGMGAELARLSDAFHISLVETADLAHAAGFPIEHVFVSPERSEPCADGTVDLRRMVRCGRAAKTGGPLGRVPTRHLALFAVQLAYVDLLAVAGIRPAAVLGHSLGEWTAATVAGSIRRQDAVTLVARRAALIEQAPGGVTIAVAAGVDVVRPLLVGTGIIVAADNGPQSCTVSGPVEHGDAVEQSLRDAGLIARRLDTGVAFHNPILREAAATLADELRGVRFGDPIVPMASGITGTWFAAGELDAAYWQAQLTSPVLFRDALAATAARYGVLVEPGPGNIRPWAQQTTPDVDAIRTAKTSYEGARERDLYEQALARLWLHGHDPAWPSGAEERPRAARPGPAPALRRRRFDPRASVVEPVPPAGPAPTGPAEDAGALRDVPRSADPGFTAFADGLADLWCALLGLTHASEDDHFFDIGGDSLLGRHLIAMIQERTGVQVPGDVVFASGSLGGMARSVHDWISGRTGVR